MAQAQILQQLPCSPTSPSGRSNIPLNEDARDIRDISQKWDDKKSSMQEDEPRADTLDEPLQSTKPGTGFSHKSKLSPREYKKRQLYKAAWKSFMTSMEDFSEESGEELETDKLRASTEVNQIGNAQVVNENAQKAPEVLYKADFYHYSNNPITGDQVPIFSGSRKSDKPILTTRTLEKPSRSNGQSILEFTTLYAVPDSNASSIASSTPATVLAEVGIYMVIRSKMILNILKSIIPYYPRRSFLSDELVLAEPFCVLLHYLEELKDRREKIEQESLHRVPESDDTPALHKHLTYLVNFVSEAYAHSLSNERARHLKSPAMCTYDWIWLLFRPGTVVYEWSCGNLTAYVVESHSKDEIYGIDQNPQPPTLQFSENIEHRARPKCLTIYVWHLVSNGEVLGREQKTFRIDMFEGEREILSLPIVPQSFSTHMNYMDPDLSTEESLIRRGKLFFALIKGCYKEYNGETAIDPKRSVSQPSDMF